MNRRDLQTLARVRLDEARLLLEAGRYDGAYYLAGYAVECALKACIARQTRREDFPPKPVLFRGMYTHDMMALVRLADLSASLAGRIQGCAIFHEYWLTVVDWTEESRYQRWSADRAARLLEAITDRQHGVLRWLRSVWEVYP